MKSETPHSVVGWLWRILVIAVAYFFGVMVAGAVITAAEMPWPTLPETLTQGNEITLNLVGSLLMAACLALLARAIHGSQSVRWLVLAAFAYVTFGLNNQIEAAIFTTFGGTTTMLLFYILPCAFSAAAAVTLFRPGPSESSLETAISGRPVSKWWWRVVIAWLAFPAIYIFFGMLAAPFVVPVYQAQDFGLTLPEMGTIIPVALGRSALYLAVIIPLLVSWSRSRRSLFWTLSIAFFAMMGLIGLLTATFFPPVLRITHSIEILGDAVIYAWLLVSLFVPKVRHEVEEPAVAVADS
jgi:hypothetical protein